MTWLGFWPISDDLSLDGIEELEGPDSCNYVEQGFVYKPFRDEVSREWLFAKPALVKKVLKDVGGFTEELACGFHDFISMPGHPIMLRRIYVEILLNFRYVVLRPISRPGLIERAAAKLDFGLYAWRALLLWKDWLAHRDRVNIAMHAMVWQMPCSDCATLCDTICLNGHPRCGLCECEAWPEQRRPARLPRGVPDLGYPVPTEQLVRFCDWARGLGPGSPKQRYCCRRCCPGKQRNQSPW
jgi:hypothetical protein